MLLNSVGYKGEESMLQRVILLGAFLFAGCVAQPTVQIADARVGSVNVKSKGLQSKYLLEAELVKRLHRSSNATNTLVVNVVEDSERDSKYKQKIYIKNEKYRYKICYVKTHFYAVDVQYRKDGLIVAQDFIQEETKDDSCDRYMFEDYKAYTHKKVADSIIKLINAEI